MIRFLPLHVLVLLSIFYSAASLLGQSGNRTIEFNRDVRPLLTDKCFACHGPDAKKVEGGLRLDLRNEAIGLNAIVPGNSDESELVRRVFSDDESERMPPQESNKTLDPNERNILRQWIAEGAEYQPHWSYTELVRPDVPEVEADRGGVNPIDQFIAARLKMENVEPSAPAERVTLIRRLYLDLTGLPPTMSEVDAFVDDESADAYEKLVDRCLDSPRFGERLAIYWLDLVRYADTVGYHGDQDVSQSPYRDYVIDAFNTNMPFDQFVREQLAGDLLPSATISQRIASGYNRLNQTTEEGGSQAKEYLAIYFADRVRNVSQVFMGATMGCAQCHDHKFDPYTSKDFYAMGAFFADLDEVGVYGARKRPPEILVANTEQREQLADFDQQLADINHQLDDTRQQLLSVQSEWEQESRTKLEEQRKLETIKIEGEQKDPSDVVATDVIPEPIAAALVNAPAQRTAEQAVAVRDYYFSTAQPLMDLQAQRDEIQASRTAFEETVTHTVVSQSVDPRTIRILRRGNWMDEGGEIVQSAIPEFLGKLDTGDRRPTRLDLANWLCQPNNRMTSRALVNRLWYLMFGRGICTSVDDLGGQGTFPSYPKLLDWLAVDFVDSGWDIKHTLRRIVTSATYRQSSLAPESLRAADPYNDLFARQGRFRIDAEMVRDGALATSGLLVERVGGVSSKPYQPEGYYAQLNFPERIYMPDTDDDQYRRGIYTHWQRTFLHPMLKAFDAPSREECTAARSRSNTPLQALTLLNDPTFVEAARVFAARIMREGGATPRQRISWAYRTAVSRQPEIEIVTELLQVFESQLAVYRRDVEQAKLLVATGNALVDDDLDVAELAAWTNVARVILNLHETITRY